jgi:hypothetical protein
MYSLSDFALINYSIREIGNLTVVMLATTGYRLVQDELRDLFPIKEAKVAELIQDRLLARVARGINKLLS